MCQIIQAINKFFISVDDRNWEDVATTLCEEVLLDYSSMGGGEPVQLLPEQIVGNWKALLPGFDSTHHQLGNFLVEQTQQTASAFFMERQVITWRMRPEIMSGSSSAAMKLIST